MSAIADWRVAVSARRRLPTRRETVVYVTVYRGNLPIGQLSPITLRKIRVFHVLEGRSVRSYATEYLGR